MVKQELVPIPRLRTDCGFYEICQQRGHGEKPVLCRAKGWVRACAADCQQFVARSELPITTTDTHDQLNKKSHQARM